MFDIGEIRIEIAEELAQIFLDFNENKKLLNEFKDNNKRQKQDLLSQDDKLEVFLRNKNEESVAYNQESKNALSNLKISIPETDSISIDGNMLIEEANDKLNSKVEDLNRKYHQLTKLAEKLQLKRKQWWKFW